jgi:hypothetical protein
VISNVEPFRSSLETRIEPPSSSTAFLTSVESDAAAGDFDHAAVEKPGSKIRIGESRDRYLVRRR